MNTAPIATTIKPGRHTGHFSAGALFARVELVTPEGGGDVEVRAEVTRNYLGGFPPIASAAYGLSGAGLLADATAAIRDLGFTPVTPLMYEDVMHGTGGGAGRGLLCIVRPKRPGERPGDEGPTWDGPAPTYARLVGHVHGAVSDVLGDVMSAGTIDAITDALTLRLRAADYLR